MNVLITSAARKVWLVQAFQRALAGTGRVLAADLTRLAPALHVADGAVLLPRSDDDSFVAALAEACDRETVGLVVPTRDGELPVMAAARQTLAEHGVRVAVSSLESLAVCLDKQAFTDFCQRQGFLVPRPVPDPGLTDLPLFARPRRGQAGTGSGVVQTTDDLARYHDHIFSEIIDAPEYTVDVFLDRQSRPLSAVPRERVVVVGGESQVTRTVDDPLLAGEAASLCQRIGLTGPATVQAFRLEDQVLMIEVNPRFGGASAVSFQSGADSPAWLIEETRGATLASRMGRYRKGLAMLRYGADLFVDERALR